MGRLLSNGPELWDLLLQTLRPVIGDDAVVAGGAIRDYCLNVPPKDIDVFASVQGQAQHAGRKTMDGWVEVLNSLVGKHTFNLEMIDFEDRTDLDEYDEWSKGTLIGVIEGTWTYGPLEGLNTFDINIVVRNDMQHGPRYLIDNFDLDVCQAYYPAAEPMVHVVYEGLEPAGQRDYHRDGLIEASDLFAPAISKREARIVASRDEERSVTRFNRWSRRNPGKLTLIRDQLSLFDFG